MSNWFSLESFARLHRIQKDSLVQQSIWFTVCILTTAVVLGVFFAIGRTECIWPVGLPVAFAAWVWRTRIALIMAWGVPLGLALISFSSDGKTAIYTLVINILYLTLAVVIVRLIRVLYADNHVLRLQNQSQRMALELSEDAIEVISGGGRFEYVNPAWERMMGYRRQETLGLPADSLLRVSKRQSPEHTSLEDAIHRRELWVGEVQNRRKDSQSITLENQIQGVFDEQRLHALVSIKKDLRPRKETELELRAFHALPDIVFFVDFEGHLLSFKAPNDPDREQSLAVVLGMSLLVAIPPELMPEETTHRIFQLTRRALQSGQMETLEYTLHPLGKRTHYEARLIPNQEEEEVLVVVRDISMRKQLERALELAQLSFRNIIERNQDGIIVIDAEGIVRFTSPAAQYYLRGKGLRIGRLFDYPLLIGTSTELDIVSSMREDGSEVWGIGEMRVMETEWVGEQAYLASIRDITERKVVENQLEYQAFHDLLTGMPNRAFLLRWLSQNIESSRPHNHEPFAVLFMDLDRFKNVNDSLGHHAGDELLIAMAERLQKCMGEGDIIVRLGGDEFVVLLKKVWDTPKAVAAAESVLLALKEPFLVRGHEIFTSASIGIAISSYGYEEPEDILRDADTAMYRAKELGKSRCVVFDQQMHHRALHLLQLENDLKRAVEQQEFVLFFQPILNLETRILEGFETLVRWIHPKDGLIVPGAFIDVAEDTGLIVPIGWWVLHEACRQMRIWQLQFPEHPLRSISVNIAAEQLAQSDFVSRVLSVLEDTGLPPESLKLEITESALIEQVDVATTMLERLRMHKIRVHMDDFGTGYSSLSYLQQFPVDALKIDRSFVSGMRQQGENTEIVRAIVSMAQSLGLTVTAEGAEHLFQLELLHSFGCERVQGFAVSRPVDIQAATYMVQQPNWFRKQHPVPKSISHTTRSMAAIKLQE